MNKITTTIRLPVEYNKFLLKYRKLEGVSKSFVIEKALQLFLIENNIDLCKYNRG